MIKLEKITFETAPRLQGIRAGDTIDLDNPRDNLRGWRMMLRGQTIYFVSPPGWHPTKHRNEWSPTAPMTICDVPRDNVFLQWAVDQEGLDTVLKSGKFDSAPFGWRPVPVEPEKPILPPIPANQIGD